MWVLELVIWSRDSNIRYVPKGSEWACVKCYPFISKFLKDKATKKIKVLGG